MIVKIWPIKGDVGTQQCLLYINDDEKVTKVERDEQGHVTRRTIINTPQEFNQNADQFFIENEENIGRVFDYMANEDKTNSIYVSGYRCEPKRAMDDFRKTWEYYKLNGADGLQVEPEESEAMAFHLVQSFPEDLDISDEEVHQCGLELLQKLNDYQGVVCSHVHPVVDEEGEVHGRCKHNHILINAYKDLESLDKEVQGPRKYHDCKETYEQLQFWNDEIAIDHGLPIILTPDVDKIYSWEESANIKRGQSWKERVRWDIEAARRATSNWNEFSAYMKEEGYELNDRGKHLTYTAPNGNKIRAERLGRQYMKESLDLYWVLRDRTNYEALLAQKVNGASPLSRVALAQEKGPLTVDIPLGKHDKNGEQRYYTLPLVKADRTKDVLATYFYGKELYDVKNAEGDVVATTTGAEIMDYLDELRRGIVHRDMEEEQTRREEAERRDAAEKEADGQRKEYERRKQKKEQYYYSAFTNSRTGRNYVCKLYDENGRRRSALDMIFIVAINVIKNEGDLWTPAHVPPGRENEAVFGPPDWKNENMIASLHFAEEEGLFTQEEVDNRVNKVGAAFSRANADVKRSKKALENMTPLANAVEEWRATKDLIEKLDALPNGPEKEKMMERYEEDLARYKKARAAMYAAKLNTDNEIADFLLRYREIKKRMPEKEALLDRTKDQYRKLKKLQYNIMLAQNSQYCYGPAYTHDYAANRGDLGRKVSEKEFDGDR